MHASAIVRQRIDILQLGHQVISIQDGVLRDLAQPVEPVHTNIGVGTHHHSKVTEEGFNPANALSRINRAIKRRSFIISGLDNIDDRSGQEIYQGGSHSDRAGSRPTTSVGGRESLVQIVMQHIESQVPRARDAQQRIHIGAIPVNQAANRMHQTDYLFDVLVEQAKGVRIGEHQAGQRVVAFRL